MARFVYPDKGDFLIFIDLIRDSNYAVRRFLPPISEEWFELISNCVVYVEQTSSYENNLSFHEVCARILYKVAKRHELGDGNKRSSVMAVYLFCLLNDYSILKPEIIKQQAKRAAKSKGRMNEELMRGRIASVLEKVIRPMDPEVLRKIRENDNEETGSTATT